MNETKWLIAREIPRLRRYALTLADSPAAADDLVQDTLERAIRKRHLWHGRGSMRSWLYRILFNVFMNQKPHRQRRQGEVEIEEAPATAVAPSQEQVSACRDIATALHSLPVEQRAAIALVALEGLPYDEAAAALDIPVGTLRSRLSRGRDQLRELYSEPGQAPHLRRVK